MIEAFHGTLIAPHGQILLHMRLQRHTGLDQSATHDHGLGAMTLNLPNPVDTLDAGAPPGPDLTKGNAAQTPVRFDNVRSNILAGSALLNLYAAYRSPKGPAKGWLQSLKSGWQPPCHRYAQLTCPPACIKCHFTDTLHLIPSANTQLHSKQLTLGSNCHVRA